MAYGKIKADALIRDNSGTDEEITMATIVGLDTNKAPKASPTFTGTVTMPATVAFAGQASDITLDDNQAAALEIKEDTTAYVTFNTTDGSEKIEVDKEVVSTQNVTLNAGREVRFADSDSSNYIAVSAPGTVATNSTWILPADAPSAGQFLKVTSVASNNPTLEWSADNDTVFAVSDTHTFTATQSVTPDDGTSDTTLDMSLSNFIQLGNTNISGDPTNLVVGTSGLFHCASAAPSGFHNDFKFPGGSYTEPTSFPAIAPWYIAADNTILVGSWTENITRS